jgi:hypothetical protein
MSSGPFRADHSFMSDRGFHRLEAYLAKHAAFISFLEDAKH